MKYTSAVKDYLLSWWLKPPPQILKDTLICYTLLFYAVATILVEKIFLPNRLTELRMAGDRQQ